MNTEARIICLSTQKGGSGKTTLAFNLAAGLAQDKQTKVAVLDIDPQQTAADLWALNQAPLFTILTVTEALEQQLADLLDQYDYLILDCPPTAENDYEKNNLARLIRIAYTLADLVILPVPLTNPDIFASVKTQLLLAEIKAQDNPNLEIRVLVNKYVAKSTVTAELEPILQAKVIFPLFQTKIKQRVSYVKALNWGKSIWELPKHEQDIKALAELSSWIAEVKEIVKHE